MHIIKTTKKNAKFSTFLKHLFANHIFESAATVSYYFLFSVFPLAIFISAAFSTLNISPEAIESLSRFIPDRIIRTLESYLEEISLGNTATLIFTGVTLTLYSMGKALQTLKRKFRRAYNSKTKGNLVKEWSVSLIFVLLVMISFYAMLILIVSGNQIISWITALIPALTITRPFFHLLRLLIITLYLFFVLYGLYLILPGIRQKHRSVLPGTLFALVTWVLMSYLFSFYLENFSSITTLYGSLGTIIALLIWLYFINLILIIGCRINSFLYLKKQENNND